MDNLATGHWSTSGKLYKWLLMRNRILKGGKQSCHLGLSEANTATLWMITFVKVI